MRKARTGIDWLSVFYVVKLVVVIALLGFCGHILLRQRALMAKQSEIRALQDEILAEQEAGLRAFDGGKGNDRW